MTERVDRNGKEPTDLDNCRGHTTAGIGDHYHAAAAGKNVILSCLKGETGCAFEGGAATPPRGEKFEGASGSDRK